MILCVAIGRHLDVAARSLISTRFLILGQLDHVAASAYGMHGDFIIYFLSTAIDSRVESLETYLRVIEELTHAGYT